MWGGRCWRQRWFRSVFTENLRHKVLKILKNRSSVRKFKLKKIHHDSWKIVVEKSQFQQSFAEKILNFLKGSRKKNRILSKGRAWNATLVKGHEKTRILSWSREKEPSFVKWSQRKREFRQMIAKKMTNFAKIYCNGL